MHDLRVRIRQRPAHVALLVADRRGGRYLRNLADTFSRHFYALDGHQPIVSTAPLTARSGTACGDHDDDGRLPDLDGARNGTVYIGHPDEPVLGRWHDARTDDMAATLDLLLRPNISTEAYHSGCRMITDLGYNPLHTDLCHTMPRIDDANASRFLTHFALLVDQSARRCRDRRATDRRRTARGHPAGNDARAVTCPTDRRQRQPILTN
ncbi:hypothetical protein [Burkholderia metallica]|uniref:hypothetical protein n=1 Tax=Burkholderia metallica TaxID=488729 RepID=UPI0020C5D21E|nr:hypothetical protein [Burkholderia metallica]